MKHSSSYFKEESVLDKIIQAIVACNSLYGLGALALACITVIVTLFVLKPILLKIIDKIGYLHAKFYGTSIQSEIDLHSKAA